MMTSFEPTVTSNQLFDCIKHMRGAPTQWEILKGIEEVFEEDDIAVTNYKTARGTTIPCYIMTEEQTCTFADTWLTAAQENKVLVHFDIDEGCEDLI